MISLLVLVRYVDLCSLLWVALTCTSVIFLLCLTGPQIMESSDSFIFGIQDNTPAPRSEDHPVVVVGDDDLDDFVAL